MRILLLETLPPEPTTQLEAQAEVVLAAAPNDFEEALGSGPFDGLITRSKGQINQALLKRLPGLRVAARCGVGLDNVDVPACSERGIAVLNVPGATTNAVAEQCLFFFLASIRQLLPLCEAVRLGHWEVHEHYQGDDLMGKTLGLIGCGDIARRVGELSEHFGVKVQFWNHRPKASPWPQVSWEQVLESSDILSLHVPLTDSTRHLIGPDELAQMKPGTLLVNTARGPVVDHAAVLNSLESGQLGAYACDVHDPEPPTNYSLLQHPRVIATPHCSALSKGSYQRMAERTVSNVLAVLNQQDPEPNCIFNRAQLP